MPGKAALSGCGRCEREGHPRMRVMFFTWLTLIGAGLVFYTFIGLSHH